MSQEAQARSGLKVKALRLGYYGHKRQREGEVFYLSDEKHFSHRWMQPVGWEPKASGKSVQVPAEPKAPAKAADKK